MPDPTDGTKVAPHGMFYMEDAGGCAPELDARSSPAETAKLFWSGRGNGFELEGCGRNWTDNQRGASNSVNRRALELAGVRAILCPWMRAEG